MDAGYSLGITFQETCENNHNKTKQGKDWEEGNAKTRCVLDLVAALGELRLNPAWGTLGRLDGMCWEWLLPRKLGQLCIDFHLLPVEVSNPFCHLSVGNCRDESRTLEWEAVFIMNPNVYIVSP